MPQVFVSISDQNLKSEVTGLVEAAALTQTNELRIADLAIFELGKNLPVRSKTPFVLVTESVPATESYRIAIRQGANDLLELPKESAALLQKLSELENHKQTKAKTIGVISGSGGAGASTTASMAAWGLKRKFQTVLVDLAPNGGGVDVIFGLERNPASRWRDFVNSQGEIPVRTFQNELPTIEGLALMSHDRGMLEENLLTNKKVLSSLLQAYELAIIDIDLNKIKNLNFQDLVIVCTNTVRSVAAAVSRVEEIKNLGFLPKLFVRELPGGDVNPEKISQTLKIKLLGTISTEPQLQKDLDRGNFILSRSKNFKTISAGFESLLTV